MYVIECADSKKHTTNQDYVFNDFRTFYEVANCLTVSLEGRYKITVVTEDTKAIQEFLGVADAYAHLVVTIRTAQMVIDYLRAYRPDLPVRDVQSSYVRYIELLKAKQLLLDDKVKHVLYNSISHDDAEMDSVLEMLVEAFGKQVRITEQMLSDVLVLNKITYPRQVLFAYLKMDRWRNVKLQKAISDVGSDVVLGAMIKNIKKLVEEKIAYLKTGHGSYWARELPTPNVFLMYRVLVAERFGFSDVQILLHLYERGTTIYDFIRK